MNTVLPAQVSLRHARRLGDHSVSNHLMAPRGRFRTLPLSAASPCSRRPGFVLIPQTRRATRPNRVRHPTDWSLPPAAPHLASQRRSCSWLRAGERMPGEDFHLPDEVRLQAHGIACLSARSRPEEREGNLGARPASLRTSRRKPSTPRSTAGRCAIRAITAVSANGNPSSKPWVDENRRPDAEARYRGGELVDWMFTSTATADGYPTRSARLSSRSHLQSGDPSRYRQTRGIPP